MTKKFAHNRGDDTPVIGGGPLEPEFLFQPHTTSTPIPSDDLGQFAYWLLSLNKDQVDLKFRDSDLQLMDESTKRQLIIDIQSALGIQPLKKEIL